MKIEVIEPSGYCSGVTNAIKIALSAKKDNPNSKIIILGQLVHNKHVEQFLLDHQIETYKGTVDSSYIDSLDSNTIAIFTAHGHDKKLESYLLDKNIKFYDATCPKVNVTHEKILKEINDGHDVIYIGKKNHPETNGALSISKNILLYEGVDSLAGIKDTSPLVINQTTLNIKELEDIYKDILSKIPNARIEKEICPTTRLRQEAIININNDVDAILIVGDTSSSNTNRLLEIANTYHKDKYIKLISSVNDICVDDLANKNYLAISSGASTPKELINEIVNYLNNYLR